MKRLFPVLAALLVLATSGCAPQVDVEAERAAIREMIMEWVNATNAKDVERMLAGYTDDASLLPPNAPLASGKEAIRKVWSDLVERPDLSESTQVTKVEVSRTGDLGYAVGAYESAWNDPEGNPVTERGKWVAIYKKQPDGTWKCVIDIWNLDQPAPTSATE